MLQRLSASLVKLGNTTLFNKWFGVTISDLRNIEPYKEGDISIVREHTAGTGLGGGRFIAKIDGSSYTDDNGTVIKTQGGAVWLRINSHVVTPLMFGAIGDGVADDAQAMKQCIASGKTVYIPDGLNFKIDTCTLRPKSQKVYGGGKLTKTSYTTDEPLVGSGDYPKFFMVENTEDVRIEGLVFDYQGTVLPRVVGVTVHNSKRVNVTKCRFQGNETACFLWKLTTHTSFTHNLVSKGHFGIATGGDNNGNTSGILSFIDISHNYITGCNSEAIDINWDTTFCKITYNDCYNNNIVDKEEDLDIGGGTCTDIDVVGNKFYGTTSTRGIQLKESSKRIRVLDNFLMTSAAPAQYGGGICLGTYIGGNQEITIRGNHCEGFNTGMYITRDNADIYVEGNYLRAAGDDAYSFGLQVATGLNINIIIRDNDILCGSGASTAIGVSLNDIDGGIFEGNKIAGFTNNYGLTLESNVRHCKVTHNTIRSCGQGAKITGIKNMFNENHVFGNKGRGVLVEAKYTSCVGNHVFDNNTDQGSNVYGIVVATGCDFSDVSHNKTYDTRRTRYQNGIQFGVSDRVVAVNNNTLQNAGVGISGLDGLTNSITTGNIIR